MMFTKLHLYTHLYQQANKKGPDSKFQFILVYFSFTEFHQIQQFDFSIKDEVKI